MLTEKNILSSALALESQSDHPTAKSIATFALAQGAAQLPVDQLTQTPGVGVAARVNIGGKSPVVLIGSPVSVAHSCIPFDTEITAAIEKAESNSHAVSVLAWDGERVKSRTDISPSVRVPVLSSTTTSMVCDASKARGLRRTIPR